MEKITNLRDPEKGSSPHFRPFLLFFSFLFTALLFHFPFFDLISSLLDHLDSLRFFPSHTFTLSDQTPGSTTPSLDPVLWLCVSVCVFGSPQGIVWDFPFSSSSFSLDLVNLITTAVDRLELSSFIIHHHSFSVLVDRRSPNNRPHQHPLSFSFVSLDLIATSDPQRERERAQDERREERGEERTIEGGDLL